MGGVFIFYAKVRYLLRGANTNQIRAALKRAHKIIGIRFVRAGVHSARANINFTRRHHHIPSRMNPLRAPSHA